jgi:hypothetical protein
VRFLADRETNTAMADVNVFLDEPQLDDDNPRRMALFHFYQRYREEKGESDARFEPIGFAEYLLEHLTQFEELLATFEKARITIGFTIKGADPNNKLPDDATCGICDRLLKDHSKDELKACAQRQRDRSP